MRIDPNTHLIVGVNYIVSPNQDDRPENTNIDLIVIHNISLPPGEFGQGYVQRFFQNKLDENAHSFFQEIKDLKVSSHLFIERSGKLTQFVPFNKRAWHAGKSNFKGREICNNFSIGIELEGTDDQEYTEEQYRVLNAVIMSLQMAYPSLYENNIVGHCDIAPDRKTDPGPAFDWSKLKTS
ncbi:MAG: 1,6-anhydro-N-acetylmuramyl-L-alanine amidase AmpD [Pseudomonadota bacterium]